MTKSLLTAVIPIHKMSGQLEPLRRWAQDAVKLSIELIFIHDFGDLATELELIEIVKLIDSDQIKLTSGRYGSPGAARNEGIRQVRTPYFCFWDSDDEPLVHTFLRMAEKAQEKHAEIAVGNFIRKSDTKIMRATREGRANLIDQVAFNPGIWRMVFRTELFGTYRFENLKWAEDQLFLSNIKFADRVILEYQDNVYLYKDDNNSSLTTESKNAVDLVPSIEKIMMSLGSDSSRNQRTFNAFLVFRQSLTLIKRGNNPLKISGLVNLFKLIKLLGISESISFFKKLISLRKNK